MIGGVWGFIGNEVWIGSKFSGEEIAKARIHKQSTNPQTKHESNGEGTTSPLGSRTIEGPTGPDATRIERGIAVETGQLSPQDRTKPEPSAERKYSEYTDTGGTPSPRAHRYSEHHRNGSIVRENEQTSSGIE
ncbi:hypothetical protein GCM10008992_26980 [Halorubrum aquaticum]